MQFESHRQSNVASICQWCDVVLTQGAFVPAMRGVRVFVILCYEAIDNVARMHIHRDEQNDFCAVSCR